MDWTTTSRMLSDLNEYENERAWQEFVGRFRPLIFGFARRLGLSEFDADDVAQEAITDFAEAYGRGQYERTRGRLRQWLFGIAYRRVQRHWRNRARPEVAFADRSDVTAFLDRMPAAPEAGTIWDREWERKMLSDCLEHVRREVEPATFSAFELVVRQGRSAAEVATELGVAVTAIYNAKHRVIKRVRELRQQLDQAA